MRELQTVKKQSGFFWPTLYMYTKSETGLNVIKLNPGLGSLLHHTWRDWSSSTSEAQASGWCCMRSTFLHILLIFLSPEGYRFPFSIPCAYFVYTVWHCSDQQHCSSIYVCMYRLFAGTWRPLVSDTTTLYYTMLHVCMQFHWTAQRIFNKIKVRASSSYPRLPLCQIAFFLLPPLLS